MLLKSLDLQVHSLASIMWQDLIAGVTQQRHLQVC